MAEDEPEVTTVLQTLEPEETIVLPPEPVLAEDDASGAEADGEEAASDAPPAADAAAKAEGTALPEADDVASECVKVAVRVRPLSAKEMAEGSSQCVSFPAAGQIVIVSAPPAVLHAYGRAHG